jgi:hypothetical protein
MAMNRRHVAYTLFAFAAGALLYWILSGANFWTLTEIPVQVTDDLFGTTSTVWQKTFRPGLDYTGPITAALALCGLILLQRSRRSVR